MTMPPDKYDALDVVLTSGSIRYSQVWEDHEILSKALEINTDDNVISIASAGCNGLSLLLHEPKSLTWVDMNSGQTALCELKCAGIKNLAYDEFVGLMGLRACADRWSMVQRLLPELPEYARRFWKENRASVGNGLLYGGRLDYFFGQYRTQHLSQFHSATIVQELCTSETLEEQKTFFETVIETPAFVENFKQYFGRDNFARHGRSPAQFAHVGDMDVGDYFYQRFRYACTQLSLRTNPYMTFFLTGTYADSEKGPLYIRPQYFERLKPLLARTKIVTCKVDDYLESMGNGHYTKANLSNIFEYLSVADTQSLMMAIASRMDTGGRIAFWNFLVPRGPGAELSGILEVQQELSARLWAQDRSWVYRDFKVACVVK